MALILTSKYKTFPANLVTVVMLLASTENTTIATITAIKNGAGHAAEQVCIKCLSGIYWLYTN